MLRPTPVQLHRTCANINLEVLVPGSNSSTHCAVQDRCIHLHLSTLTGAFRTTSVSRSHIDSLIRYSHPGTPAGRALLPEVKEDSRRRRRDGMGVKGGQLRIRPLGWATFRDEAPIHEPGARNHGAALLEICIARLTEHYWGYPCGLLEHRDN